MLTLLAVAALLLPTALVVSVLRGRVRPTCCAPPAESDARLRGALDHEDPEPATRGA